MTREGRCILRKISLGARTGKETAIRMQAGPLQVEEWTPAHTAEFSESVDTNAIRMAQELLKHAELSGASDDAIAFLRVIIPIKARNLEAILKCRKTKPAVDGCQP